MVSGRLSGAKRLRDRNQSRSGWPAARPAARSLSAGICAAAALPAALLWPVPVLLRRILRRPLWAARRLLRLAPALVEHDPERPAPDLIRGSPRFSGKIVLE